MSQNNIADLHLSGEILVKTLSIKVLDKFSILLGLLTKGCKP